MAAYFFYPPLQSFFSLICKLDWRSSTDFFLLFALLDSCTDAHLIFLLIGNRGMLHCIQYRIKETGKQLVCIFVVDLERTIVQRIRLW